MRAKRTWQTVASVLGACVVGYFVYHTVEGERGIVAQLRLENEVEVAEGALDRLRGEREALDRRVHLMRPETLDPDLLDEEARKTLNYSKPNEVVILSPSGNK